MTGTPERPDLLDYPRTPGWRTPVTSIEAAEAVAPRVTRLRDKVLRAIAAAGAMGLTADEAAARLGLTPFTSRPRCTELKILEAIMDSGVRRENESGHRAIVWIVKE